MRTFSIACASPFGSNTRSRVPAKPSDILLGTQPPWDGGETGKSGLYHGSRDTGSISPGTRGMIGSEKTPVSEVLP